MSDWLNVGLAGAEKIELDDLDASPKTIVYRVDEPLTRDVCRMLLRVAHLQSCRELEGDNDQSGANWTEFFASNLLRRGLTNDHKEIAVGLLFCCPRLQSIQLKDIPFICNASVKLSRDGNSSEWKKVPYRCTEFIRLKNLVKEFPLDGLTILVGTSVENREELKGKLRDLGARVLKQSGPSITHYVYCPGEMMDKGQKNNVKKHSPRFVTADWVNQYVYLIYLLLLML